MQLGRVGPKSNGTGDLIKGGKFGARNTGGGESHVKTEAETESLATSQGRPHQKLEEIRKVPPLETSGKVRPCPHLHVRPPASKTVKEDICYGRHGN